MTERDFDKVDEAASWVGALEGADAQVAWKALITIGSDAIPALERALDQGGRTVLGQRCLRVLSEIGEPACVPILLRHARSACAEIRRAAVMHLYRFTSHESVLPTILEALGDPSALTRHAAAHAIAWCDRPEVEEVIRGCLQRRDVRDGALTGLMASGLLRKKTWAIPYLMGELGRHSLDDSADVLARALMSHFRFLVQFALDLLGFEVRESAVYGYEVRCDGTADWKPVHAFFGDAHLN